MARADTPLTPDRRGRALLTIAFAAVIAVFVLVPPIPQPAGYFAFADDRMWFGVPNFLNVASNALFLVFGVYGLERLLRTDELAVIESNRQAWIVLFTGVALTAFGSAWFHLWPDNDSLFWDRLPMTVAFMALFAVVIGEHISASLARTLLWPLLLPAPHPLSSGISPSHPERATSGSTRSSSSCPCC